MTSNEIRRAFHEATPVQFACGLVTGVTLAMIVIITLTILAF